MKTLISIGTKILTVVTLIVAIGFFLPGITRLERTANIAAPTQTVFEQINDLKNWKNWSPWFQLDPAMRIQYSQPSSVGVGAYYTWASENKNLGKGKLTILDAKPLENVHCNLDFDGMGASFSDFKLIAKDSLNTQITWSFEKDHGLNPLSRWFGIFMNSALGPDYDKGLVNIKAVCEKK